MKKSRTLPQHPSRVPKGIGGEWAARVRVGEWLLELSAFIFKLASPSKKFIFVPWMDYGLQPCSLYLVEDLAHFRCECARA